MRFRHPGTHGILTRDTSRSPLETPRRSHFHDGEVIADVAAVGTLASVDQATFIANMTMLGTATAALGAIVAR